MPATKKRKTAATTHATDEHALLYLTTLVDARLAIQAIEGRIVELDYASIIPTFSEEHAISKAYPDLRNQREALLRLVRSERGDRERREAGVSRDGIKAAEAALARASDREQSTLASIEDLDVGDDASPAIVRQITKLEERYSSLKEDRIDAERALRDIAASYQGLVNHCPAPLKQQIGLKKRAIRHSEEGLSLRALKVEIQSVQSAITKARRTRWERGRSETESWIPYLLANCPDAINGRDIDSKVVEAHIASLQAKLPDLESRYGTDKESQDRELLAAEELLHVWAENGHATPAELLPLLV